VSKSFLRARASPGALLLSAAAVAVALLMLSPSAAVARAPAGPSAPSRAGPAPDLSPAGRLLTTVPLSPAYDWPELHRAPGLSGYTTNTTLSTANASKLGVAWSTNLYGSALDSPVVAYDPWLKETLAYIGTELGNVEAVNLADGRIVWGMWTGSPVLTSPLVYNGSVYIGTYVNPEIFRLNASTGVVQARAISPEAIEATPTVATPPGGIPTVFLGTLDAGVANGPFLALNAVNLSTEWSFTGYNHTAGSWDSASYAVTASGTPMVLFGTDNPDVSVYALNALTGKLLWRFQALEPNNGDWDVASGVTISPPGANGFSQGVAYVINKLSYAYALDLNNGTQIWRANFDSLIGHTGGVSRSTAALDGTNLVLGDPIGLVDLNASTGKLVWSYKDATATESLASPAIAGSNPNAIVITADIGGSVDVLSLATGKALYTYPGGGYFAGSPAVSDGNIVVACSNGFLYDFAVGGGNDIVLAQASITSPSAGAVLANPNGSLTVSGSSNDTRGVAAVDVAIQSGGMTGRWWDAAAGSWSPGPVDNHASLGSPRALKSSWSLTIPVPKAGGTYQAFANAVSTLGQTGLVAADVDFAVAYNTTGPHIAASSEYVAPGGKLTVTGGGFGPSATVTLTLGSHAFNSITAHANGSLPSTTVTLPTNFSFGPAALTATGATPNLTSSVEVIVANSWDQLGAGPGHVGYESNDLIYNYLIFPGGNNWEKLAWHFEPGATFNASPAVVQGVVYVASTSGQLFAVDLRNGGLEWTFQLASGAALDGSPAVDARLGLVFVGANDGTLDAVYMSNGTLAWSDSVGGNVTAPIFANGVLYVTTSHRTVEAASESNGRLVWSDNLTSSITAAAGLNATGQLLVVGESNGAVVGLNSSSGALRWSYLMGGAVTAAPTVSGGRVYVGSANDKVVALSQSKGALVWSFKTNGPVDDTGSLSSNRTNGVLTLFIGSNGGYLYGLQASSGTLRLNVTVGAPIVSVSTANGIAILETSNGKISATRTWVSQLDWTFTTGAGLVTAPVLEDGAIYVAASDGNLYAFTTEGQPPS
jgi:eukaryotic-like serine/threonine-protein kinase